MIIYYFIFLLILSLYILGENNYKFRIIFLFISALILFVIAAFRSKGVDNDYGGYESMFNSANTLSYYLHNIGELMINNYPMVLIVSSISKNLFHTGVGFLFLVYAFFGVSFKIKAIKELSPFLLLSVLIYFSNFFLLHEMTQIRSGVATGLLLLSIPSIEKKHFLNFMKYVLLASLFHYTALIFIPLYFISTKKINITLYMTLLIGSISIFLLNISIHHFINILGDNPLTHRYFVQTDTFSQGNSTEINPFNILAILHLVLSFFFLMKAKTMALKNKYSLILIKIYIFSIVIFYLFSDLPVFAFRLYEVLTVVEIILIPFIIYVIKQKNIAICSIVLYALGLLSLNLLHNNLIQAYSFR